MTYPKTILYVLWGCLFGLISSAEAAEPVADVVTMKNGDFHIGKVNQDTFLLETAFGELSIAYSAVQTLTQLKKVSRIVTHSGEQISGQLLHSNIEVSRLQSPTIPVAVGDIARIKFGAMKPIQSAGKFDAKLETTQGDLFDVRIVEAIELQTDTGKASFKPSELRYLDVNQRTDEDELIAQVTSVDGSIHQGGLTAESTLLSSPHLAEMAVSFEMISRLSPVSFDDNQLDTSFSDELRNLGVGPEMVRFGAGSFLRGDHQGDGDTDEQPMAMVNLKAYAIGRYEITFAQYDLFCEQTRCDKPDDQEWGRGQYPVMNVSWVEAAAYAAWLADKTGKPYRLPSDAEWEFAHRSGSTARYWWGDGLVAAQANCEGCGSLWDGDQTAPVGRFSPNPAGLYDTAGNVFEWVADCYHDRFSEAPADGSPVEKPGCGKRVIRGGAWSFPAKEIRSANRWRDFPNRRSDDTGFRVAMDLAN